MSKYVIPRIDEPIMTPNGTMSLSWYLYLTQGGSGGGLPAQTGHAGEFLTTDGTDASWSDAIGYHPDLFDHKWADHILNDVQWLRADTFSWQSGAVYEAAYQHLLDDWNEVGDNPETEIIEGIQIWYRLAPDGHKICSASQESSVAAIYTATGVAWYYILDTRNQRFKLPRTKFGVTGLRDTVGNYVAAGLPNITGMVTSGRFGVYASRQSSGAFTVDSQSGYGAASNTGETYAMRVNFDASRSSSVYGSSDTVQPPATQMYLYFYVGEFTQTALENTAGITTEILNDKVDKGHEVIEFQAPTADNDYTWYRKYADGWVEQGGQTTNTYGSSGTSVSLPVTMSDTNYHVMVTQIIGTAQRQYNMASTVIPGGYASSTSTIFVAGRYIQSNESVQLSWEVKGIAAN